MVIWFHCFGLIPEDWIWNDTVSMKKLVLIKRCSHIHSPVLWLTYSISRARTEQVAGLGQSLDKLCNTLSVALLCPERAHHGGQHSLYNASEQFRAQRVCTGIAAGPERGSTGGRGEGWATRATGRWLGRKKQTFLINMFMALFSYKQTCTHQEFGNILEYSLQRTA